MEDNTSLEEINRQLKIQNSELAQRLQFWRVEYSKLEKEKADLVRENTEITYEYNKSKDQLSKFKNIEFIIKQGLTRSLTNIVRGSEDIRKVLELYKEHFSDVVENTSPKRNSNQGSPISNNVNHVHPMIKGVTIKKPVIRISRAVFEPIEPQANVSSVSPENDILPENTASVNDAEQVVTASPVQQVELLDLYVSLARVDSPGSKKCQTPQKVLFPPLAANSITDKQTAIPVQNLIPTQLRQGTGSGVFTIENPNTANFLPEGSFEYRSRLECVVEETDSAKWDSSQKLNPFVVLSRSLGEDTSKSEERQSSVADDPLEGPSWRYDHVTTRKKKKSQPDDDQLPDLTTNGSNKDASAEQTIFDKTFPSSPEYQSTPVSKLHGNNKKVEETPETETNEPSPENKVLEHFVSKSRKKSQKNKAVLVKTEKEKDFIQKKSPRIQQSKINKMNRQRTTSKYDLDEAPPKKISKLQSLNSSSPRGSTLLQTSTETSSVCVSARPRRGEAKNYAEKPLNKKLRRNGNEA